MQPPLNRSRKTTFGLTARLLVVLLAFGAAPLVMSIFVGYRISRSLLISQVRSGIQELAKHQATQVATELRREQLLLLTIADQLGAAGHLDSDPPEIPASLVLEALPQSGTFDGLRLVSRDGRTLSQTGLRPDSTRWPRQVPAADWPAVEVAIHRSATDEFVAYVLAVPAGAPEADLWLEGHVDAADALTAFAMPAHTMGGAETAILDADGRVILTGHPHAAEDFSEEWSEVPPDSFPNRSSPAMIDREAHLRAQSNVDHVGWRLVSVLPLELALEPLSRVRDAAVLSALVLVLLILVTAWLAARSISQPLRALAASAENLGRGHEYVPVERTARDEIGLLAGAFRQMSQDLADSSAQIEELQRQEMQRAEQLASVGEMASAIAHEIKNPLAGVLYAVELARRRAASDEDREILSEAETQLRRLNQTASQLLHYARPPDPRRASVDARLLIERAVRITSYQAAAAGVELETAPADTVLPVLADPDLLVQVLVNLTLNAIQASGRGGKVRLAATGVERHVELHVADDGPGVPAARAAEIFRPFFTTKHMGTGLGLAISRQIVERHEGTIELRSSQGNGALFVIVLPVSLQEA